MNLLRLKMKNYVLVVFKIALMLTSFSLPFIFTEGAYENMISKGHYLWFTYFILLFLFTIYYLIQTNYYELISAKIQGEKLIYGNLLIFTKEIQIAEIQGFKNGIDENSNEFISLYNSNNRKIATLNTSIYSNIPEFINALDCENLGYELTVFQKTIRKLKNIITNKEK